MKIPRGVWRNNLLVSRQLLNHLFVNLLVCSAIFKDVQAEWQTPPMELSETAPEGIVVDDKTITILENVGTGLGIFRMVKLKPMDPSDSDVTKFAGDDSFILENDGGTWYMSLSKPFDYENMPSPTMNVILKDSDNAFLAINVTVIDVNDNEPRVEKMDPEQIEPIKEDQIPAVPILTITAIDDDKADIVTFSIKELAGSSEYFSIKNDGKLSLIKELDYNTRSSHRLTIILSDDREPFHKTLLGITVLVEDVPNRPPEFTKPPIIRAIVEETPIDTLITTVEARDGDYGLNWNIVYSIEDEFDLLKIDPEDGQIKVKNKIDAESAKLIEADLTHTVKIIATEVPDSDNPGFTPEFEETEITFSITDINDQKPQLCGEKDSDPCTETQQYSFTINEDHIGQIDLDLDQIIRVVDADSATVFNSFTAGFAAGTNGIIQKAFTITPTRGTKDEIFYLSVNTQNKNYIDTDNLDLEGFWLNPQDFTIEFVDNNNSAFKATAKITATVNDINDNSPIFVISEGLKEYRFVICENTEEGTALRNIVASPDFPKSCPKQDPGTGKEIIVQATDLDASENFGQNSIIYRWSQSTRQPPIDIDSKTGKMKMAIGNGNFDYERFQEETFMVEAIDSNGASDRLSASVPVIFTILDKNDVTVDLRLNSTKGRVKENTTLAAGEYILNGINATDLDTTAKVEINWELSTLYSGIQGSSNYKALTARNNVFANMNDWFKLEYEPGSTDSMKLARIVLGSEFPDREANGEDGEVIDRVDLLITAEDIASDTGPQIMSQTVTIIIEDINDNPPKWVDDGNADLRVLETEEWSDEGDQSSDYDREIQTFRATDPDTDTMFKFSIDENDGCEFPAETCTEIRELFELTGNVNPKIGAAILKRKKGKLIDREAPYIKNNDDKINLMIVVSDGENKLESKIQIKVEDRNDNTPEFDKDYSSSTYEVYENVTTDILIETINATDKDHPEKFGNVSYLLVDEDIEGESNNGMNEFRVNLTTGKLTAIPGKYEWFDNSEYRIRVKAIDYYRPSSQSGSNYKLTYMQIKVIDANNNPPEFLTKEPLLATVKERDTDPGKPIGKGIILRDKDNPDLDNGKFSVEIESVTKTPQLPDDPSDLKNLFRLGNLEDAEGKNEKELMIYPKHPEDPNKNLTGFWGKYTIMLKATDHVSENPLSSSASYVIEILNENLCAPEFVVPEKNFTEFLISIPDSELGKTLVDIKDKKPVPNIYAEDRDKGSGNNGEVTYSLEEYDENSDCRQFFQLNNVNEEDKMTGKLTLKAKPADSETIIKCQLRINASDLGETPQSSIYIVVFHLLLTENNHPAFPVPSDTVKIKENTTGATVEFRHAIDQDIELENPLRPDDEVFYMLKGGDSQIFDLSTRDEENENGRPIRIPILTPRVVLDRETVDTYTVSVYATNDKDDKVEDMDPEEVLKNNNTQWIVVTIEVEDIKDTAPVFLVRDGMITGGFSEKNTRGQSIATATVHDADLEDYSTFKITSGFDASDSRLPRNPFILNTTEGALNQVKIVLTFEPQRTLRGYYTFQLTATDMMNYTAIAECRMYMISEQNRIQFFLVGSVNDVIEKRDALVDILTDVFSQRCNIDNVYEDENDPSVAVVETHFINSELNAPLDADYIVQQQYVVGLWKTLMQKLNDIELPLTRDGFKGPGNEIDSDSNILVYMLMGGVGVLTITLLILGASCFYNNRSLSLRVKALSTTAFGSQQSGLNRAGALESTPNTNTFAIEGSNPVWTEMTNEKKNFPDFDMESIGSGGSVLIGAEDEDYFQKSSKNPVFQAEDVVANYDSDGNENAEISYGYENGPRAYESHGNSPYPRNDESVNNESPFPTKITRNPLMNLGDAQKSIDIDEIDSDEPYGFEQNTDGALF